MSKMQPNAQSGNLALAGHSPASLGFYETKAGICNELITREAVLLDKGCHLAQSPV